MLCAESSSRSPLAHSGHVPSMHNAQHKAAVRGVRDQKHDCTRVRLVGGVEL